MAEMQGSVDLTYLVGTVFTHEPLKSPGISHLKEDKKKGRDNVF